MTLIDRIPEMRRELDKDGRIGLDGKEELEKMLAVLEAFQPDDSLMFRDIINQIERMRYNPTYSQLFVERLLDGLKRYQKAAKLAEADNDA